MKGLTIKQKKFADEYIISGNATQSAIKAGYSEKTAGQTGAENLKKTLYF
ncbi:terminase small subunit [Anaerococcus porci]|nr:terminase small subunit [Anaerococcus porci]MDY3007146.1 terminase small subunit [Anaerococcus porci]